jgi:hypothetical protein
MRPVIVWPRPTGPTPAGVPVKIRSPGLSVHARLSQAMVSRTFQIMSDRSPRWRGVPSTSSPMAPVPSSPVSSMRWIAPIGAEWSKPLAMDQGRPAFLAVACRSRRVMSRPTA